MVSQSQLWGFHTAPLHNGISQWLLAVFKSVLVAGVGTLLSVHRIITEVVFSHPVMHHPRQKIMEGIFLYLGCKSPNVAIVTNSLRLITVGFLCKSPRRAPIFAFWLCNFPGTCFSYLSPFLELVSQGPLTMTADLAVQPISCWWTQRLPLDPPFQRQSLGVGLRTQLPKLAHGR